MILGEEPSVVIVYVVCAHYVNLLEDKFNEWLF